MPNLGTTTPDNKGGAMNCIKCAAELPAAARYCPACGFDQQKKPGQRAQRKRGNGQGTAIKRGKTWTAVWSEGAEISGRNVRQIRRWKGGFATKTAALAYAAAPPKEQTAASVYEPTLRDYHEDWEKSDYLDLSSSKQCAFRIAWRKLEQLHDRTMQSLTIRDLQACVDDQAETYYPARDMRTLLSHLFKRAVAEGQARTNLAEFVRIPPLEEKERQPFTAEEVKKLWAACGAGDRMAGLILLMIYSGMMPGELKQCRVEMIDTEKREILGCGLKTKKRRETPIIYPESISPVIDNLIATSKSSAGYLLGMNQDNFYDEYHATLQRIGVRDLPPYSCRHTTATALAMAKAAPSIIQEIMRHTKFATTQRYIHPDMSKAHAAINELD